MGLEGSVERTLRTAWAPQTGISPGGAGRSWDGGKERPRSRALVPHLFVPSFVQ